ncbi:MAG: oxidoreductase domain protein [Caulobacteraceae bacterium]|nr:oxidoreductase domain protein [Caulobacteraceae bacterium]
MTQDRKAGVVGAGVFGGYHANQYAKQAGAQLAAVFDIDLERARALAGPHGAQAFDDLAAMIAAVDMVSIASPAVTHAGPALAALSAGRPVYVEKPLAVDLAQADAIVAAAAAQNLPLACGHQERAVFKAMGLLDVAERPIRLEAVRVGTPSIRCLDVSAVLDLMIHDLDLGLALAGGEGRLVSATGSRVNNPGLDEAQAEVDFGDGFTAHFRTSRVAPARERTTRIVYPSGVVEIDLVARTFSNTTPHALNEHFAETPIGKDPLGASIGAFIAAVRGEGRPLVTGEEARAALALGLAVEQAAG